LKLSVGKEPVYSHLDGDQTLRFAGQSKVSTSKELTMRYGEVIRKYWLKSTKSDAIFVDAERKELSQAASARHLKIPERLATIFK
jgi:hypothetical protein